MANKLLSRAGLERTRVEARPRPEGDEMSEENRTWLYHPREPEGRIFVGDDIGQALEDGWQETRVEPEPGAAMEMVAQMGPTEAELELATTVDELRLALSQRDELIAEQQKVLKAQSAKLEELQKPKTRRRTTSEKA